jgi:murein DD-endopeptidase MepM/ murein hydrolase activator NlpD
MNGDKDNNKRPSKEDYENTPLAESLEKDDEFIKIKSDLYNKKTPGGIAWDKATGLHREFIIRENENYLEARRIFSDQYPNRYKGYLELEKSFPSKIKTDSEYREQRLKKLTENVSEKTDKSELTYEEYEKIVDELSPDVENRIQQDIFTERPDIAQKHGEESPVKIREAIETRFEKVPPQPGPLAPQPVAEDEKKEEKRSDLTRRPRKYAKEKVEEAVKKRIKGKAKTEVIKPPRTGRQIFRSTKEGASRLGRTASRKTVQAVSRLGRVAVQAGSRALTAVPGALAGAGSTILEVFGIFLGITAAITAAIGWFIAQTIIYIIFLAMTVAFILFIINSGAYVVPPGGLTSAYPGGGGPGGGPLPDSCPGIWPIAPGRVIMTQGAYARGCTHGPPSVDPGLEATDYSATTGHEVYAGHDGTVVTAGWDECLGNHIIIESTCNGRYFRSVYGHLSTIITSSGANVTQGQRIGRSGNTTGTSDCTTGAHLHYSFQCPDAGNPCGADDSSYINRPPYMSADYLPEWVPRGCCQDTLDCGISF